MPATFLERSLRSAPVFSLPRGRYFTARLTDALRLVTLVLLLALVQTGLTGCEKAPSSRLPTVSMPIGSKTFTLEIAAGGAARTRGLMMRDSVASDHGMVFCFAEERELSFWMDNTRIPLDILYLDGQGRVVSIRQMQPYLKTSTPSEGKARFAIELNEGTAAAVGVKPGDRLALPAAVTSAVADP